MLRLSQVVVLCALLCVVLRPSVAHARVHVHSHANTSPAPTTREYLNGRLVCSQTTPQDPNKVVVPDVMVYSHGQFVARECSLLFSTFLRGDGFVTMPRDTSGTFYTPENRVVTSLEVTRAIFNHAKLAIREEGLTQEDVTAEHLHADRQKLQADLEQLRRDKQALQDQYRMLDLSSLDHIGATEGVTPDTKQECPPNWQQELQAKIRGIDAAIDFNEKRLQSGKPVKSPPAILTETFRSGQKCLNYRLTQFDGLLDDATSLLSLHFTRKAYYSPLIDTCGVKLPPGNRGLLLQDVVNALATAGYTRFHFNFCRVHDWPGREFNVGPDMSGDSTRQLEPRPSRLFRNRVQVVTKK